MANILITGASGFIGSYLAHHLSQRGHSLTATARTITPQLRLALPECAMMELDVLKDTSAIRGRWDCIIHTATANDVVSKKFRDGMELSTVGTQNVLELGLRLGVPHVVFLSTLQVYGAELNGVITEKAPVHLVNAYGLNHHAGELTCQLFSRTHGLKTSIIRPANVFGCPISATVSRWSLVPMCFVREALSEGTITLRSSGLQRRDFVSLRQVAGACAYLIGNPPEQTATFNVASSETWSMLDAARWVMEIGCRFLGREVALRVMSDQPKSPNDFTVESSITPPPLGGSSSAEMSEEIAKMFEFFRNDR